MGKKKILENIDKVLNFHKDELIKTSEPTINFKEVEYLVNDILTIFKKLKQNIDFLDQIYSIQSIQNNFQQITNILEQMNNFNPLANNANTNRQNYISELKRYYNDLQNTFLDKFRIYLLEKSLSNTRITEILDELEKSKNQIKSKQEEFDSLIETYKRTTLQMGVGVYEDVFKEEAEENKNFADNFWSYKTSIFIFLGYPLLLISINYFHYSYIATFDYYIISINLIITSFFILILLQFFKMYNSHMHLYKLNKHRQNSLRVFEAFIKTADDEKTKNIIRLQATKTIFESGDTGFVKNVESKQQDLNINNLIGRNSE